MKARLEAAYLDYFNNFLTIDYYASYYGLTLTQAKRILNLGRELNHKRSKK